MHNYWSIDAAVPRDGINGTVLRGCLASLHPWKGPHPAPPHPCELGVRASGSVPSIASVSLILQGLAGEHQNAI